MTEALKPGDIKTRHELQKMFGGGLQGGIIPSTLTPNILIFSDPETGHKIGYYDGWLPEIDERGPIFEYTGHGEQDQTFVGRNGTNNRAILRHLDQGRALRVFKAIDTVPGTRTKRHRYIGKFELDDQQPYLVRQAPNKQGKLDE